MHFLNRFIEILSSTIVTAVFILGIVWLLERAGLQASSWTVAIVIVVSALITYVTRPKELT